MMCPRLFVLQCAERLGNVSRESSRGDSGSCDAAAAASGDCHGRKGAHCSAGRLPAVLVVAGHCGAQVRKHVWSGQAEASCLENIGLCALLATYLWDNPASSIVTL